MHEPLEGLDPAAALAAIGHTRLATLERMDGVSMRYDLTFATLVAVFVSVQALPLPINMAGEAAVLLGFVMLARWHRARTGVWISGVGPRRARWVALTGAVVAGAAAITVALEAQHGQAWIAAPAALLAGVAALVVSRVWRRVYRSEVASGDMRISSMRGGGVSAAMWAIMAIGAVISVAGLALLFLVHVEPYAGGMIIGVGLGLMLVPPIKGWFVRLITR